MSTIGERVLQRRTELGLSQEELAIRLGYKGKAAISRIERGLNAFPQAKLPAFAKALNCSVNYLTGTADSPDAIIEQAQFDAYILKDPDIKPMLRKFVALPDDKK
jgi:transcriptional regulator with XRE-family HTH domain